MSQHIIIAILYGCSCLILVTAVCGWRQTTQLLDGFSLQPMRQMARFAGKTRHLLRWTLLVIGTSAAITLAIVSGVEHFSLAVAWAFACVATCLAMGMRAIQPPVVLFLTSSSPHAGRLLWEINLGLVPLRAVALLDPRRMGFTMGRSLLDDNLRTRDPNLWKSVVHRLIEMAAVVVIDTRGNSDAVRLETLIMLDPRRIRKALFITTLDGHSPALEDRGIHPADHGLQTVTDDELIPRLRYWTKSPKSLPCPVHLRVMHDAGPLRPESLDTLPSVLMAFQIDSFDSRTVIEYALSSDKVLLALSGPLSRIDEDAVQRMLDLSWEFLHEPSLVLLVLEWSGLIVIRIDFLRMVARELSCHTARASEGLLTFAQLNQSEPIWAAVQDLASELIGLAETRNLTYRFITH